MGVLEVYYFFMRIKLPLFDNPTVKQLHPMCREGPYGMTEGVQLLYFFPNRYGASVVQFAMHITRSEYFPGKYTWELGVLSVSPDIDDSGIPEYHLCYTTEITDDVIKPLYPTEVEMYLQMIAALPPNKDYGMEALSDKS